MGFEPNLNYAKRYSRSFNSLNPNAFISPFFFMAANTTGVAGAVVKYSAADTVTVATSGTTAAQFAGFLMQNVKDLDAGAVKGYRNLNNTEEALGGNVGVLQSNGPAETLTYLGSPTVGTRLCTTSDGYLRTYGGALETGDPIAVVEATTAQSSVSVEPTQTTATSPTWLRIRIYGL